MSPVLRLLDLEFGSDNDKFDSGGRDGVVLGLALGNKIRFKRRGWAAAISPDMLSGAVPSSSVPERVGLGEVAIEAIRFLHKGHWFFRAIHCFRHS